MEQNSLIGVGEIGALLGSGAYFAHMAVNGLTMAYPTRPNWVAFIGSVVFGILFVALLTVASDVAHTFSAQLVARVILVGIAAGSGAAGTAVTQASAEAKRQEAKKGLGATKPSKAEPDSLNPIPNPNPTMS